MDITNYDMWFICGFLAALAIIFIFWLIYRYYKWVEKVNDELDSFESYRLFSEESISNLQARIKKLEKNETIEDDSQQ